MRLRPCFILLISCLVICSCHAQPQPPGNFEVRRDVPYADTTNPKQMLDLYLPKARSDKPNPMVVFIHGGGWEGGDKNDAFVGFVFALIHDLSLIHI